MSADWKIATATEFLISSVNTFRMLAIHHLRSDPTELAEVSIRPGEAFLREDHITADKKAKHYEMEYRVSHITLER